MPADWGALNALTRIKIKGEKAGNQRQKEPKTMIREYERDYAGWVEDTAYAIEEGRFDEIDRVALPDEVRDLGKSEKRELASALRVLLLHMLKVKYKPEKQGRSWVATIRVQGSKSRSS